MVAVGGSTAQQWILSVLFDRATSGKWTDASLTRPRISELIKEKVGAKMSPAILQIHLDDLLEQELVARPQRGVRDRFQITPRGIQEVDAWESSDRAVSSETWTGSTDRYSVSEEKREQIVSRLRHLQTVLDECQLTNAEKSQAAALLTAAVSMAEAPQPPWEIIKQVLMVLANISATLILAFEIAKLIS
jgi:DNA-binding PadR family transcriptional regulator